MQRLKLLLGFEGKGSTICYDTGVLTEAFRRIPALQNNQVVITASSGGSVLAVYFSCHGISRETVEYAARRTREADYSVLRGNENVSNKTLKLLVNEPTEMPMEVLKGYIGIALGLKDEPKDTADAIRRSRAVPKLPLVIVAANKEVLDNRGIGSAIAARNLKEFDLDTYDVSWKPEVYESYRTHPEQFAKDNRDLKLGPTRYIGKACTYFVDKTMFGLLRQIPREERLGDLRLVTDAADLALAIQAASAEPTYFHAVPETDYGKLMVGDRLEEAGNSVRRSYCGGFIMPLVAQDVRRMLPWIRVLGTSSTPLPRSARQLVQAWYLVDTQPIYYTCNWWLDFEFYPSEALQRQMAARRLTPAEEFEVGKKKALEYFRAGQSRPRFAAKPKYCVPAARALDGPADPQGESTLELTTMRGLGSLLQSEGGLTFSTR
jgi:hypothetical protein